MQEKRNHNRMAMEGKVVLLCEDNPAEPLVAQLVNISYGGICVNSGKALKIGTAVQFDLSSDFLWEHFCGKGRIASVREEKRYSTVSFRTGIDFTEVDKNKVLAIINTHASRRTPPKPSGGNFNFDLPA